MNDKMLQYIHDYLDGEISDFVDQRLIEAGLPTLSRLPE